MPTVTSVPFKLRRGVYERYVASRWLSRRWWVVAVPIAAATAAAIVTADLRWALVALMYLFIITPGIVALAYFRYLLNPEARLTALAKRVVIEQPGQIRITYLPDKIIYENEDEAKEEEEEEFGAPDRRHLPPDEVIDAADVKTITLWHDCYVVELTAKRWPRFLLVPRKALDAPLSLFD